MKQFIIFWLSCLWDALTAGKFLLGFITVAGFVLWLWHGRRQEHQHETVKKDKQSITKVIYWACFLLVPGYALFIAPYLRYSEKNAKAVELIKQVEDSSPKLEGFIDQTISAQQANTNILIFQVSIGN